MVTRRILYIIFVGLMTVYSGVFLLLKQLG